jgi:hypothetical protein
MLCRSTSHILAPGIVFLTGQIWSDVKSSSRLSRARLGCEFTPWASWHRSHGPSVEPALASSCWPARCGTCHANEWNMVKHGETWWNMVKQWGQQEVWEETLIRINSKLPEASELCNFGSAMNVPILDGPHCLKMRGFSTWNHLKPFSSCRVLPFDSGSRTQRAHTGGRHLSVA